MKMQVHFEILYSPMPPYKAALLGYLLQHAVDQLKQQPGLVTQAEAERKTNVDIQDYTASQKESQLSSS